MNPKFEDIAKMSNKNVIFTNMSSFLDLVLYFYQTEDIIYETEAHRSNITKIKYNNNVVIYLNEDYEVVTNSCKQLCIPFKYQNKIQLANEAFQIHTKGDKLHSTFNSETRKVFFDYKKGPFVFSNFVPDEQADLLAVDIKKCYTHSISKGNKEDWPVFTIFDEIEVFKGKLRPGVFYVETTNYFPLKKSGWYHETKYLRF